jgi:hypothetical protein
MDFQYKAKENIVRGFINLLPKVEAIEIILFSLKDARESVEVEKTYEFIKSKLSEIKLQQRSQINHI